MPSIIKGALMALVLVVALAFGLAAAAEVTAICPWGDPEELAPPSAAYGYEVQLGVAGGLINVKEEMTLDHYQNGSYSSVVGFQGHGNSIQYTSQGGGSFMDLGTFRELVMDNGRVTGKESLYMFTNNQFPGVEDNPATAEVNESEPGYDYCAVSHVSSLFDLKEGNITSVGITAPRVAQQGITITGTGAVQYSIGQNVITGQNATPVYSSVIAARYRADGPLSLAGKYTFGLT